MSVRKQKTGTGKLKRRAKKAPAATNGMPLFIKVDKSTSTQRLRSFIRQVMDDSGLVFHQKNELLDETIKKIRGQKSNTLTAQIVMAHLAIEEHRIDRPLTPDGLPMPEFNANARVVLNKRYLVKNARGQPIEQPWEMLKRVAWSVAKAERKFNDDAAVDKLAKQFHNAMACLDFLPNSPTLMNAGRELEQLSACFVLPIDDSMESIFQAIKHTALIHKSGGGTGFSFSRLRPTNDIVKSTKGVSSGPISFMTVFDAATDTIKQGGTRRGANMGILRVDHPDIYDFITCKQNLNKLNNFNISVAVTDDFMKAVDKDREYSLVNPRTGEKQGKLKARKIHDLIVQQAWAHAEPGMIFIDRINRDNPTPELGEIEATNPCGEQPLLPYESCNLASINLARMIQEKQVDWEKLRKTVRLVVRFLDDVIEINKYPLPEIREKSMGNRKIGLGIMGFAELLIALDVAYDSEQGIQHGKRIMEFIQREAHQASCDLAAERGPFPNIGKSIYRNEPKKKQPRNATVTTIAPTGSLSILAGTSSGIEPIFGISFVRRVLDQTELVEVNPLFEQAAKEEKCFSQKLMRKIAKTGSVRDLADVPERLRKIFATAHDIAPEWHVRMQAAFQEHTDNAVSKTVNFPADATPEQVDQVFRLAHELGCKGITIYRYGTREPVLDLKKKVVKPLFQTGKLIDEKSLYNQVRPRRRPQKLRGSTELMLTGCGKLYITVNRDNVGICELFSRVGRTGGCPSQSEAIGRLVSLAIRSGVALDEIIHQLNGIPCHSAIRRNELIKGKQKAVSCPAAISLALTRSAEKLKQEITDQSGGDAPDEQQRATIIHQEEAYWLDQGLCPDCHTPIEREGGCAVCRSCGFSKCS